MKNIVYIFILSVILWCSTNIGADTLDYDLYNSGDDTPAGGIEFPGIDTLEMDNLWIVSPQYVRVRYSSTAFRWAIRIITKNNMDIKGLYPRPLDPGKDREWEWKRLGNASYKPDAGGNWQVGDDVVSYGGLINEGTKLDPNSRATLAWQVYRYNDPYYPIPALNPSPPPTTLNNDKGVGGGPTDDWAYIADAGDTGYVLNPINNYFSVANGSGDFSLLAQHPVVYRDAEGNVMRKSGGGDCLIYIAARFGRRDTDGVTDIGVLPAGGYKTTIYLELITW